MTDEKMPDEIWAQPTGWGGLCYTTSKESANDKDTLYIRADLAQPPVSDAERVKASLSLHWFVLAYPHRHDKIVGDAPCSPRQHFEQSCHELVGYAPIIERALQNQAVTDRKEIRQFIASAVCGYDKDREILNTHPHLYNQRIERLTDDLFSILDAAPVNKPDAVEGLEEAIIKPGEILPGVSKRAGDWVISTERLFTLNEAARRYMKLSENGAPQSEMTLPEGNEPRYGMAYRYIGEQHKEELAHLVHYFVGKDPSSNVPSWIFVAGYPGMHKLHWLGFTQDYERWPEKDRQNHGGLA